MKGETEDEVVLQKMSANIRTGICGSLAMAVSWGYMWLPTKATEGCCCSTTRS